MRPKKEVHFGERFYRATLHIISNFHLKRTQIAAEMGTDNATISRWVKCKDFKPQQSIKQEALRKFGINPLFFRDADVEEMLLPCEVVEAFPETGEEIKGQIAEMRERIERIEIKLGIKAH